MSCELRVFSAAVLQLLFEQQQHRSASAHKNYLAPFPNKTTFTVSKMMIKSINDDKFLI
jgi:hypothetical protein